MKRKTLSFALASLIILLSASLIIVGMLIFDVKLQLLLLLAWVFVAFPAGLYLKYTYKELEDASIEFMKKALQPAMIMFAVGALIATFLAAGTVPTLIYYGIQFINPTIFLFAVLILCSITSLATGTSWGAIGTVGIAMLGIGISLNIPIPLIVGSIISGSVFGDKMSPLSDTTIFAPAVSGAEVMQHIRHMMYTTIPAYLITAVLFIVIGVKYGKNSISQDEIDAITRGLVDNFNIGFISLIPMIILAILLLTRRPSFPSIMIGALLGLIVAVLYQGYDLAETLTFMYSGFKIETGLSIDKLLNRGGVFSFAGNILIMLFSLGFAGVLRYIGIIEALVKPMLKRINSVGAVVASTAVLCYGINLFGSLTLGTVLTATIMTPVYREYKLKPENLSRALEDFGTLGSPMIPWTNYSLFIQETLGITPWQLIQYSFLLYITPIFSLIYGVTGFTMTKYTKEELAELK